MSQLQNAQKAQRRLPIGNLLKRMGQPIMKSFTKAMLAI